MLSSPQAPSSCRDSSLFSPLALPRCSLRGNTAGVQGEHGSGVSLETGGTVGSQALITSQPLPGSSSEKRRESCVSRGRGSLGQLLLRRGRLADPLAVSPCQQQGWRGCPGQGWDATRCARLNSAALGCSCHSSPVPGGWYIGTGFAGGASNLAEFCQSLE